jgi:hypothetical protein
MLSAQAHRKPLSQLEGEEATEVSEEELSALNGDGAPRTWAEERWEQLEHEQKSRTGLQPSQRTGAVTVVAVGVPGWLVPAFGRRTPATRR